MDDANVPSLLSIPYLGYRSPHDPDGRIANNTRRFVLSKDNPHYYIGTRLASPRPPRCTRLLIAVGTCSCGVACFWIAGRMARGVGSRHTRRGWVWHIALTMQALTADNTDEILDLIATCEVSVVARRAKHNSAR
jgi:meiotically up-regulated gene 157 (Mug157) protein